MNEINNMNDWKIIEYHPGLTPEIVTDLWLYRSELLRFSKAINLVSNKSLADLDTVHFGDSIMGCRIINNAQQHERIFDIGSGNGFPGVVMGILYRELPVSLVESDGRKCEFLKHICSQLKLKNVLVVNESVQALGMGSIGAAMSRGFADIPKALLTVNRVMKRGGVYFHFKGEEWASEVANMPSQLFSIWEPGLVDNYVVPGDKRKLSIVKTVKVGD